MSKDFLVTMAVIVLGVVAAGRFLSNPRIHPSHTRSGSTERTAADLGNALKAFDQEYSRLPDLGVVDMTTDGPQGRKLLTILLGKEAVGSDMENPRQIVFLSSPKVTKNKAEGGLVYINGGSGATPEGLYDAWGEPYEVFLCVGAEESLTFHDGKAIVQLPGTVAAVLSKGPDKIKGTDDDIQKW